MSINNAEPVELVYYKNDFPQITRNKPLSLTAQRIEGMLISRLDRRSAEFNVVRFSKNDLLRCGISRTHYRRDLKSVVNELQDFKIELEEGQKEVWTRLLDTCVFDRDSGIVDLEFNKKLASYLLGLKSHFTRFNLKMIMNRLNSSYAASIYKILIAYLHNKEDASLVTFELVKLKASLGVAKSYKSFSAFEKLLLAPAIKEVNKDSDLHVEYDKIKEGRKIVSLKFYLRRQDVETEFLPFNEANEVDLGGMPTPVEKICEKMGYALVGKARSFIEKHLDNFGEEVVLNALQKVAQWPDKDFQARMVKSLLPGYCINFVEVQQRKINISAKVSDSKKAEQLLKMQEESIAQAENTAWQSFMLMEEVQFNLLIDKVKSNPDYAVFAKDENICTELARAAWKGEIYNKPEK